MEGFYRDLDNIEDVTRDIQLPPSQPELIDAGEKSAQILEIADHSGLPSIDNEVAKQGNNQSRSEFWAEESGISGIDGKSGLLKRSVADKSGKQAMILSTPDIREESSASIVASDFPTDMKTEDERALSTYSRADDEYTCSTMGQLSFSTAKGPLRSMLITKISKTEKQIEPALSEQQNKQPEAAMQVDEQKFDRKGIKPSKYRDIGWSREMGQPLMQSIRPTSYIDEFRHPENAGKNDWSNLVHVNGYIKNPEENDLTTFEDNKRHKIKETRHECNQGIKPQMRKDRRRKRIRDHIKEKHSRADFEAIEDRVDLDCESLSSHSSEDNSLHSGGSFKQLLDDIPLRDPTDKDYMFVANRILPREQIEEKLLRMQRHPSANTIEEASKEISAAVQKKRLGRRLLKQRIDSLGGFDDVRSRFSVESRAPDVNHVITFNKMRKQNPQIEQAKAELLESKEANQLDELEPVDLGSELIERINKKLEEAGLPQWSELGYREPEEPATLFLTEDARPMELLVEYRKIDNIGLIHKPYLVDYQTDKVTGEPIAMPRYCIHTQTAPQDVLDRLERLTTTGHFNRKGQKYVSAGYHMQNTVYHQMTNKNFLENAFTDYMQPAGTIECGMKPDYFDQFYQVLHDNTWETNTSHLAENKLLSHTDESSPDAINQHVETTDDNKIEASIMPSDDLAEAYEKEDQFETFGVDVDDLNKSQRFESKPKQGDGLPTPARKQSEDTVTFGSI
ncbi:uncharacterized protein LOC142349829 isoform X2 [Convolutriloba macropyga]